MNLLELVIVMESRVIFFFFFWDKIARKKESEYEC